MLLQALAILQHLNRLPRHEVNLKGALPIGASLRLRGLIRNVIVARRGLAISRNCGGGLRCTICRGVGILIHVWRWRYCTDGRSDSGLNLGFLFFFGHHTSLRPWWGHGSFGA